MARDFDGVDDVILATITAVDSGDWTFGAWVRPDSAGENNVGQMLQIMNATPAAVQVTRMASSGRTLFARQFYATSGGDTTTTTTIPTAAWSLVFATHRASDSKSRVYIGDLDSTVAEAAYASQNAGTGARVTGGTTFRTGNDSLGGNTFDGRIAAPFFIARELSLDEMEAIRLGLRPIQAGVLRIFLPLDSPTASQAEDLSGNGANGTVTGAIVAEDPPVPMGWGENALVVVVEQAAAGTTYEKTGAGVRGEVASGADAFTAAEMGAGLSAFFAAGPDEPTSVETGAGASAHAASGAREINVGRAGTGVAPHTASGADAVTFVESGLGVVGAGWGGQWGEGWGGTGLTASGADAVTFVESGAGISARAASGAKEFIGTYEKAGAAVSARVASGGDSVTFAEAGAGVTPLTGSGADAVTSVETSSAVSARAASGADEATFVEAGSGISARVASGEKEFTGAVTYEKTGIAISARAASGADSTESAESGSAVTARAASGADQFTAVEGGAAVAPFVASGQRATVFTKTGIATITFNAAGTRVKVSERTGTGIAPFVGGGSRGGLIYARAGAGVLVMRAGGRNEFKIVVGQFDPPGPDFGDFDVPSEGGGFDAPSPLAVVLG